MLSVYRGGRKYMNIGAGVEIVPEKCPGISRQGEEKFLIDPGH
jgi:hypothetical protein